MTSATSDELPDTRPALVRSSRSKKMAMSEPTPIPVRSSRSKKNVVSEPVSKSMSESVSESVPIPIKRVRVKKSPVMKDSSDGSSDTAEKKRENKWLNEVRKFRELNPTCSYKDALKGAKEHYKR